MEKLIFTIPEENKAPPEETEAEEVTDEIEKGGEGELAAHEKIARYIKSNDQGKGVETEEIIKNANVEECEKVLDRMLKEGDLFETMPGRLKVLE